ncbi:marine proteobacterial sortase target protein [Maricurvus nonylphenolicus]|uniref:marine proteobacterial sortase target protein n=1 Tax=Maricurvus nonylphenolicus TaxID=1008307 RepID=UPI0036F36FC6
MFNRRRIDKNLILKEDFPEPKPKFHLWKILLAVLVVFFAIGISETARAQLLEGAAETNLQVVNLNDAKAGQLLFRDEQGQHLQALHLNSRASIKVTGMVATIALEQDFKNTTSDWQEAIYVFPLQEQAAVSYMEVLIGERRIIGKIKEKQEAKRIYTQAKQQGKKAALMEQQRPNMFTQSVANIAPGETIKVTLHYQHAVTYDQGEFSLRFPMTLTPRYIPGSPQLTQASVVDLEQDVHYTTTTSGWGWSLPSDQVADAHRITPFMQATKSSSSHNMQLDVVLDAGLPLADINSPYHDIAIKKQQGQHRISTRTATVAMDRDFALHWRPVTEQAPAAAVFQERLQAEKTKEDYAMLMLLPPYMESQAGQLPRQVTFIIDTSGSMQGTSIVQAKKSLQLALGRLQAHDQFNVIEFNSRHTQLFATPQMATAANIQQAKNFVHRLQANGGTEMTPALQAALTTPVTENFLKQIVFITDGSVGNETALFALIDQHLAQSRLFTVGIGSAPNSYFMRKAAEFGRGTFTHIGKVDEVASKMDQLFRKLESPVLSNLKVEWPDNMQVDTWPKQLPDLYLGEPLVLHSRFDNPVAKDVRVNISGQVAGKTWQRSLQLQPQNSSIERHDQQQKGIAKLWARKKIGALLDEKVRGKDPQIVRDQVLDLALHHQLVSPYTSLVAVEEKISRPAEAQLDSNAIPNLVAKGQKPQPQTLKPQALKRPTSQQVAYPKTATSAPLNMLLGLFAALGLLMLRRTGALAGNNHEH